jgi:curved DNA-binding protein CbpA
MSWTVTYRIGPEDDGLAGVRAVLGVPPGAPPDAVRRAYRRKLKEVHPDPGGSDEAVRQVVEAYRTLTRP